MSLLSVYLQAGGESVTWRHRTGTNVYNAPTYSTSSITVLWFDQKRIIKSVSGEDVECSAKVLADENIIVGDQLTKGGTNYTVEAVESDPSFNSIGGPRALLLR